MNVVKPAEDEATEHPEMPDSTIDASQMDITGASLRESKQNANEFSN